MCDEVDELKLGMGDRDGLLLELQREEAAVQASMTGTPNDSVPPGLLMPNGFYVGKSTATGAGQDGCFNAVEAWTAKRMEEFKKNKDILNCELKTINKCRIFLQAFSLADITTGDGTKIATLASQGKKGTTTRAHLGWPNIGTPSALDWKTWNRAINITFTVSPTSSLQRPLGPWLGNHNATWHFEK